MINSSALIEIVKKIYVLLEQLNIRIEKIENSHSFDTINKRLNLFDEAYENLNERWKDNISILKNISERIDLLSLNSNICLNSLRENMNEKLKHVGECLEILGESVKELEKING